jgi:hypothetical protein
VRRAARGHPERDSGEKQKPIHHEILKFPESEARISAGVGKINDQVTVISMTWGGLPPFLALSGGGQLGLLFVV